MRIAACLNASPDEIIFTSGGSESDNQAILSAAWAGAQAGKRHITSTAIEHHAVLHTLEKLEREGYKVELLDVHSNGAVSAEQVERAIREDTCLVTVMYANNEIGSIQPVSEIGAICRAKGVTFHTDAVRAAGRLPIDVQAQNIDLLSLSAHKFHGPKGVGALYARNRIPVTRLVEGGDQEWGRRAGTENVLAIMGMAVALEEACSHMAENMQKVSDLRNQLIAGLSQIPCNVLNGGQENRLPGNVNFSFEGIGGRAWCCCWINTASAPPPALRVPLSLCLPAMCCWQSAAPMRRRPVRSGSLSARRIPRRMWMKCCALFRSL